MTLFRGKRMSPMEPINSDRNRLIQTMIDSVNDSDRVYKRMTTWEIDFVESVTGQWNSHHSLSAKQFEILERIYTEKVD